MLLTKTVFQRKKNARTVLASIEVHSQEVGAKLTRAVGPYLGEGEKVDFVALQLSLGRCLEDHREILERADDAHIAELMNDRRLRQVRERSTRQLYLILSGLSRTLDGTYGPGTAEDKLGLGPGLRPRPHLMLEMGRRTATRLAEPGIDFGSPDLTGVAVTPEEVLARIEPPLAELGEALQALSRERSKFHRSLRWKQEKIAEYDLAYSQVASALQALYRLVGEDLLAERLRPKLPQSPSPEDETVVDDETGEPVDTAGDGQGDGDGGDSAGDDKEKGGAKEKSEPAAAPATDNAADGG